MPSLYYPQCFPEHAEQLEWIKTRLNGAADDRAEDGMTFSYQFCCKMKHNSAVAIGSVSWYKLKTIGLIGNIRFDHFSCESITAHVHVTIYFVFLTDDWQPLPLVTMTEESELALRDKSFQKLLKKIGLAPPTNEQVCGGFVCGGLRKCPL